MHSLIDFHRHGGIVNIDQTLFKNFKKCGSVIANPIYPDTAVLRNLQIDSSQFAADLAISFDESKYLGVLNEYADILTESEITGFEFSECPQDLSADPSFDACFQILIKNSEIQQINNNLNEFDHGFSKTGKDFSDSIVPQYLGYFISLHQYQGSLLLYNNKFM